MRVRRYQKIAVVSDSSPGDFQDKLNDLFMELEGKKFNTQLFNNENGFSAYITYEEVEKIPECLKDEFDLKGITFTCKECPYFESINRFEGECDFCRGTLHRNDDVCQHFWDWKESETITNMYSELKKEIKAQYGTYGEFAKKVGINYTHISAMFHGHHTITDKSKLKMLKALGIEINEENLIKYFEGEKDNE